MTWSCVNQEVWTLNQKSKHDALLHAGCCSRDNKKGTSLLVPLGLQCVVPSLLAELRNMETHPSREMRSYTLIPSMEVMVALVLISVMPCSVCVCVCHTLTPCAVVLKRAWTRSDNCCETVHATNLLTTSPAMMQPETSGRMVVSMQIGVAVKGAPAPL